MLLFHETLLEAQLNYARNKQRGELRRATDIYVIVQVQSWYIAKEE